MKVDVLSLKLTVVCFTVGSPESGHSWDQEIERCLVMIKKITQTAVINIVFQRIFSLYDLTFRMLVNIHFQK